MNWLNNFKIAVLERDLNTLERLSQSLPKFSTMEEMQNASALLLEAKAIFQEEQNRAKTSMNELKKQRKILVENITQKAKINLVF